MTWTKPIARVTMIALGAVMMMPVVRTVASTLSASGYNVVLGINGEDVCNQGGDDDCPW